FRQKLEDYQANINNMLPAVRTNTERELQQLQQNLQQLQEDAQLTIQQKQAELMEPVFKQVSDAIQAVAKGNGFNLILSGGVSGLDVVLYGDEQLDVSDLVLRKMGITPKPRTDSTSQNETGEQRHSGTIAGQNPVMSRGFFLSHYDRAPKSETWRPCGVGSTRR